MEIVLSGVLKNFTLKEYNEINLEWERAYFMRVSLEGIQRIGLLVVFYVGYFMLNPVRLYICICCILTFDPAKNAIQGDAPEEGDTF